MDTGQARSQDSQSMAANYISQVLLKAQPTRLCAPTLVQWGQAYILMPPAYLSLSTACTVGTTNTSTGVKIQAYQLTGTTSSSPESHLSYLSLGK